MVMRVFDCESFNIHITVFLIARDLWCRRRWCIQIGRESSSILRNTHNKKVHLLWAPLVAEIVPGRIGRKAGQNSPQRPVFALES